MEEKNKNYKEYRIRQTLIIPVTKIIFFELLIVTFLNFIIRFFSFNYLSEFLNNLVIFLEIFIIQIINIYVILKVILSWLSNEYILRNDEIIVRKGLINNKEITYEIANLQSMIINQDIFGKIFNYGTIRLFNPVLKEEIFIENIDNPKFYGNFIQKKESETPPIILKSQNQRVFKK